MTSQQGISGEYGEEAPIRNSSPDLLEKVARQEVRSPTFERSGGLRTAVIVTAVLYIAGNWFSTPVTSQLIASGAPGAFIAYNVWMVLLLLVAIANFVLVGLWLGRARRNADRIAPDQQSLSSVWVWLGWIVRIVNFWFPKQVIDEIWRSTVRAPEEPRSGSWWGAFIAAEALIWLHGLFATVLGRIGPVVIWMLAAMMTIAGVGWIRVVRTISDAQDALAGPVAASCEA